MQTVGISVYATISSARGNPSAPIFIATAQNAAARNAGRANRRAGRWRSFFFSAAGIAGSRQARMMTRNTTGTSVRTVATLLTGVLARLLLRHEPLDEISVELPRPEVGIR